MIDIKSRCQELLDTVQAAIDESALSDLTHVTISQDGRDVEKAYLISAGFVIVYAMPVIEWPAPRVSRLTWTIAVGAKADDAAENADRIQSLLGVLYDAGVIRWPTKATPTDFDTKDMGKIPGYTITHTEEDRS